MTECSYASQSGRGRESQRSRSALREGGGLPVAWRVNDLCRCLSWWMRGSHGDGSLAFCVAGQRDRGAQSASRRQRASVTPCGSPGRSDPCSASWRADRGTMRGQSWAARLLLCSTLAQPAFVRPISANSSLTGLTSGQQTTQNLAWDTLKSSLEYTQENAGNSLDVLQGHKHAPDPRAALMSLAAAAPAARRPRAWCRGQGAARRLVPRRPVGGLARAAAVAHRAAAAAPAQLAVSGCVRRSAACGAHQGLRRGRRRPRRGARRAGSAAACQSGTAGLHDRAARCAASTAAVARRATPGRM